MQEKRKTTFATAIFDDAAALRRALIDLISMGFSHEQLILLLPGRDGMTGDADAGEEDLADVCQLVTVTSDDGSSGAILREPLPHDGSQPGHALPRTLLEPGPWLSNDHRIMYRRALERCQNILFVNVDDHQPVSSTCSILLSHSRQMVFTHEMTLAGERR